MIIYTRDLDYTRISSAANVPDRLLKYVKELVPQWALCFPHIVDNQRYYVATQLRTLLQIPFKVRKAAIASLCDGVRLEGLTTECFTVAEVLAACNQEALKALVGDYYGQQHP